MFNIAKKVEFDDDRRLTEKETDRLLEIYIENEEIAERYAEQMFKTPYVHNGIVENAFTLGEHEWLKHYDKLKRKNWKYSYDKIDYRPYIPDEPKLSDLIKAEQTRFSERDRRFQENFIRMMEDSPPDSAWHDEIMIEFVQHMTPEEFYIFAKKNEVEITELFLNNSPKVTDPQRNETDKISTVLNLKKTVYTNNEEDINTFKETGKINIKGKR